MLRNVGGTALGQKSKHKRNSDRLSFDIYPMVNGVWFRPKRLRLVLILGVKVDYCLPWNSLHFSSSMSLSIDDFTFDSHSLCFKYATPAGS